MLRAVDEPISLRLYFSKRLGEAAPVYARYFERVRALLQQYSDISGGRVELAVFDPEPFSDAEDKAVAAGLRGVRLNQDGEVGYFGLVGSNSTDTDATIPFFTTDREAFLEYDLTKLIYTLANPKKRVVGLITSLPLDGGMNPMAMMGGGRQLPPQMIMEQIRDFFDVKTLAQDVKEIPADVDVLMVAQPDKLTPEAAYAIDQYVLGGGKILALVDPVAEMGGRVGPMGMGPPSAAEPGVHQAAEGVGRRLRCQQGRRRHRHRAARAVRRRRPPDRDGIRGLARARSPQHRREGRAVGRRRAPQPRLGRLPVEGRGGDDAGDADPADEPAGDADRGREVQRRARSGRPAARLQARRQAPDAGRAHRRHRQQRLSRRRAQARQDGGRRQGQAGRGQAGGAKPDEPKPDAAKDAKPKDDKPAADAAAKPHKASGRINAIVIADTDLLADQFWVDVRDFLGQQVAIPNASNAAFVVNALDNLSGSDALIALRGRGAEDRPFKLVNELRRDAERATARRSRR